MEEATKLAKQKQMKSEALLLLLLLQGPRPDMRPRGRCDEESGALQGRLSVRCECRSSAPPRRPPRAHQQLKKK